MMTLDRTRPGVAAMAVGIARAAFEFAVEYSKERVQFGVPIAMHQAIQFMIADMATDIEAGRLLTWQSAVLLDQGKRNTLASSHAKRFAGDAAMKVTTDAVQVYGGYGFIKEYPVEKLMRDAKIMQLYEGTAQIQRLVIARETLLPRRVEEPAAGRGLARTAVSVPVEGRPRGRPSSFPGRRRVASRDALAGPRARRRRGAHHADAAGRRPLGDRASTLHAYGRIGALSPGCPLSGRRGVRRGAALASERDADLQRAQAGHQHHGGSRRRDQPRREDRHPRLGRAARLPGRALRPAVPGAPIDAGFITAKLPSGHADVRHRRVHPPGPHHRRPDGAGVRVASAAAR